MFEVNNGIAKINGNNGKYTEDSITNPSVRYGRNSVQNFYTYIEQPIIKDNHATPPILDLGLSPDAAEKNIEKIEKYVKENDTYLKSLPPLEYEYRYMPNLRKPGEINNDALFGAAYEENYSAGSMDLNKDGVVDIGEYGASILTADMISNNGNINGTINRNGHNAVLELNKKANAQAASELYSAVYNQFDLGNAAKKFQP